MFDLRKFAFDHKLQQAALVEVLGIAQSQVSNMMNGIRKVRLEHIAKLRAEYGDIVDKYITSDDALTPRTATMAPYPTPQEVMKTQNNVVTDAETVDLSVLPVEVVEELKAEVAEEIKREESIIIVSPEVANAPDTNIKKYIKDKGDELERMYLGDLLPAGVNIAECVRKTSMLPSFHPGDWIFVKFINKDNITDGETYYFDFNTRPTMIRKVKLEGDDLRLIAKNPQFGDIIIKRDEINNIGDIVGMFRNYFGDQYDDIEDLRRKNEVETSELRKQTSDALRILDRLVTVIEKKV